MALLERAMARNGRHLLQIIEEYAVQEPVQATFKGLVHHGRHARSKLVAHHLREQLCVRLSHQARRMELFPRPPGASSHHFDQLMRVHTDTLRELHDMKPVVDRILHESRELSLRHQRCDPLDDFKRCIEAINNRHTSNVETLMEAKMEMSRHPVVVEGGRKKLSPRENQDHRHHRHHHLQRQVEEKEDRLQLLVDEFLAMHISFQLLCRHYLQSLKPADLENSSDRTGLVAERCLLSEVVADAMGETQLITEHHLVDSPDVIIEGDVDARASCIPSHVHHIIFEVLKNALRATALNHAAVANELPPVRVRIAEGKRQVSVCISDEGGGMSMTTARNAFRYLWTSSERHAEAQEKHQKNASYQPGTDPLSGMGIGLPVSRLYARHFGGDLKLMSLEGFGTHVGLFLPAVEDGLERLPRLPGR
ncbi:unnamed protein product [Ascophyllum nodosum]